LRKINARIRCLLDKDHQIGHSYFIGVETDLDIFKAIKNSVIPLLEEYFYNDTQKIRQILNEKDNSDYNFYKKDETAQNTLSELDPENENEIYILNDKLSSVDNETSAHGFIAHISNLKG